MFVVDMFFVVRSSLVITILILTRTLTIDRCRVISVLPCTPKMHDGIGLE